jgi:hypothetical protein
LYHGKLRIAPYSQSPFARVLFHREPFAGASASLELRPDSSVSRPEQRRGRRAGGPATRISDDEVGNCSPPTIGSAGQLDEVRVSAEQSFAQERPRAAQDLRGAVVPIRGVEAPEPYDSAIAKFDIETLIDADGFHPPCRPPASRKAGIGENDGQERGDATESPNAIDQCAAAVRETEIHAKGMPRGGSGCP